MRTFYHECLKKRLFALREMYDAIQQGQHISAEKLARKHRISNEFFPSAILDGIVKAEKFKGAKNVKGFYYKYTWNSSIPPNIRMIERIFKTEKEKRDGYKLKSPKVKKQPKYISNNSAIEKSGDVKDVKKITEKNRNVGVLRRFLKWLWVITLFCNI